MTRTMVHYGSNPRFATRLVGLSATIVSATVISWAAALWCFQDHKVLLYTCLLAYTFGLRHALDADHIAAIDNVTRKLMAEGKRPVAVGFYFSLGHSTIVVLASAALAISTSALKSHFEALTTIGGFLGAAVSASFLFLIAGANILVLIGIVKAFQRIRAGGRYEEEDLDLLLAGRGFLSRIFRPLFGLIDRSWHMYLLGFVFGLGFDTATEIGVLGLSAQGGAQGLSIWSIMIFPALFTAGMTLIDTLDSVLMVCAYGWAFVKPIRKLYYNMTITFVSIVVALAVGSIEALSVVGDQLGRKGGFWAFVASLNDDSGRTGLFIVALFIGSWLVSAALFKVKGLDRKGNA